jgi:hypothetical protein
LKFPPVGCQITKSLIYITSLSLNCQYNNTVPQPSKRHFNTADKLIQTNMIKAAAGHTIMLIY